jgi:hypothetical protein
VIALEVVPAEVGPAQAPAALVVDLLELVLSDVSDRDPAAVEREPVGVSQAEGKDLVPARLADKRVAARASALEEARNSSISRFPAPFV